VIRYVHELLKIQYVTKRQLTQFSDDFLRRFTCLYLYKILLRLVGIWPCYDKKCIVWVFMEHGKYRCFSVTHVSQGSVATYVRCGGMSTQHL